MSMVHNKRYKQSFSFQRQIVDTTTGQFSPTLCTHLQERPEVFLVMMTDKISEGFFHICYWATVSDIFAYSPEIGRAHV